MASVRKKPGSTRDVTTGSPGNSGGNSSPSTRPRLSNRPSPGVASENAQLRIPGWAANRRASASCIDAMRAILVSSAPSRSSPGRAGDGTAIDATSTRLVCIATLVSWSIALNMRYVIPAANRAPTPSPTSTMIRAPVTRPKRTPPTPPPASCRVRWGDDPVARSAGRTPANTALATPSASASITTSGVTPRSTQNGRSMVGVTRSTIKCMPSRPTPVARRARTSVSTKS